MDLKRLRYFCRVVEHGSVSQAAKSLNMAPVSYTHLTLPTTPYV